MAEDNTKRLRKPLKDAFRIFNFLFKKFPHFGSIRDICFSVFILSVLFTGLRLTEMILHRSLLFRRPFSELISRLGFSFSIDLIFFFTWNTLYIFFYQYCEKFNTDKKFLFRKILFYTLNLPLLILFFLDMQTLAVQEKLFYFSLLSAFKIEMFINSWVFIIDYWYLALIILTVLFVVFKYLPVLNNKRSFSKTKILPVFYINSFFILLFVIVLARFGNLPFQDEHKYNGMFIRLANIIYDPMKGCKKFFSDKEVLHNLNGKQSQVLEQQQPNQEFENIILFVIESLSLKYVRANQMPFLTNLSLKGISFKNHFTSELITVLSTVSLLSGENPSLLTKKIYLPNLEKILQLLKGKSYFTRFNYSGYTTLFFFGDTGTVFGFNKFVKNLGVSHSFFKEDYLKETGKKQDLDKEGNIYEKPFLKFAAKKIKEQKTPFFSVLLTNQIHYPFFCAPNVKLSNSIEKRQEFCLKYVDKAIENFFQDLRDENWFNKTLFIVTSDHPNKLDTTDEDFSKKLRNLFLHNIPLVLYHPTKNLKKYKSNQVSSHADIIPSLMDYLSIPHKASITANSIFQLKNKRRFFTRRAEFFYLIENNYLTMYTCSDKDSKTYFINERGWESANHETQKKYDKLIKSYIQYEYSLK